MLHVSLLGEQAITDDRGGSVRARSSRAVVLVAFLVVHAGSPQARQRIAGLFWPESTDAQALTNLRRELHHLRQVIGDEPSLVVTSRDLCWRDEMTCRVDVRVFDIDRTAALAAAAAGDDHGILLHGTAAITAYRGELLPGVYEDWLLETRSQLERQCVDVCDLVAAARARTGDLAGAVAAARRRVQLQPLEEVGYRTLMELQADLGDRSGAVSTYHHCASVLERELGVAPDPSTRAAFQRLMAHARPAVRPPAVASSGTGRPGLAAAQLFGRSAELSVLRDVWRGKGQSTADLDDSGESHCKKMTDAGVGFDDYAAGDATDRITAWRARLEREGKLGSAGSLRDLIMRPAETAEPAVPAADTTGQRP